MYPWPYERLPPARGPGLYPLAYGCGENWERVVGDEEEGPPTLYGKA